VICRRQGKPRPYAHTYLLALCTVANRGISKEGSVQFLECGPTCTFGTCMSMLSYVRCIVHTLRIADWRRVSTLRQFPVLAQKCYPVPAQVFTLAGSHALRKRTSDRWSLCSKIEMFLAVPGKFHSFCVFRMSNRVCASASEDPKKYVTAPATAPLTSENSKLV
jgi:hypothetical protein